MPSPPSSGDGPTPVWVLRGETALRVECWMTETEGGGWTLTVTHGGEVVLDERYADTATVLGRAHAVKEQLIGHGWKPEFALLP